jgi:hypothetical protein
MERWGPKVQFRSHIHIPKSVRECEGMSPHTPKWTPTLRIKFFWSPKFLESDLTSQNSLDWKLPYIIINILRHRFLKWACMIHLSTYNTSYGQKKGWESNCQFDSQPLKIKNHPKLCVCKWCVTYPWKALNKGYDFALKIISIGGLQKKLWASKVTRVPISKNLGLPTWESWEKWHLGATPMANHKEYYKGEGGGFPQVQAVVSLCMLVVRSCTKSISTMHYQLVWFM